MNLLQHYKARESEIEKIAKVKTPKGTVSWCPIPHISLFNLVTDLLAQRKFKVEHASHQLTRENKRYFSILQITHPDLVSQDSKLMVGIRNAHDKMFAAGMTIGESVIVCSNLVFSGEVTFGRRHTKNIVDDLAPGINNAIDAIGEYFDVQQQRVKAYKGKKLDEVHAYYLILKAIEEGVIGPKRLNTVLSEWKEPSHAEFKTDTVWKLYNAVTESLKTVNPFHLNEFTENLHRVFDPFAGLKQAA